MQALTQAVLTTVDTALHHTQEQLDQKLQHRQARETGICPIREELYAQCFGMCASLLLLDLAA